MTPFNLLRATARTLTQPPAAPELPAVVRPNEAAAAVRRAKRLAEAVTPAEWIEAAYEHCPSRTCDRIIRDAAGVRGDCGIDCRTRRRVV